MAWCEDNRSGWLPFYQRIELYTLCLALMFKEFCQSLYMRVKVNRPAVLLPASFGTLLPSVSGMQES